MSSPRRSTGPAPQVRQLVWDRAGGCCERCGKGVGSGAASIHHRKPRRMGGSKDPEINSLSNLVLLCGTGTTGCHGWVESNRLAAYGVGLLLPAACSPEKTALSVWGRGWCYLRSDGTYHVVDHVYRSSG